MTQKLPNQMTQKLPNQTCNIKKQARSWNDRWGRGMLCLGAALFVFSQTARAQYTPAPIGLTGWNAEIIAANNAPGPSAGTTSDLEYGYAFYEQGAPGSPSPGGFPTNNKLTSASGLMATFQIQPYNGDNALVLGGTVGYPGTNTLTLTTPCHFYNYVEFLVEGVNNPTWEVTLNFSDGSTSTYNTSDLDWTQGGPGAATLDAVTQSSGSWGSASYYTYVYLQEHDIAIGALRVGQDGDFHHVHARIAEGPRWRSLRWTPKPTTRRLRRPRPTAPSSWTISTALMTPKELRSLG